MSKLVTRIGIALIFYLVFFAIAAGIMYWLSQQSDNLNPARIDELAGDTLDLLYQDAFSASLNWLASAFGISFLCGALFLAATEGRAASTDQQSRGAAGIWWLLLILFVIISNVLWWAVGFQEQVIYLLLSTTAWWGFWLGAVGPILVYFLATAMLVKSTMKLSVPLAAPFPTLVK